MSDAQRPEIRPFRFGVQASRAGSRREWADLATRAEANGYSALTMPDHFDHQLAPVPALMTAADVTTELRIGGLVWDNDYKHPVVLAKELATLDVLSDGRLEIGLGAGWMRTDYERAGMPYDRPGIRIDRFIEGVAIIRGLMGEGPFSFEGTHYRVTNMEGTPKPVQLPHPPLLIGGGGKRMLGFATREADIVAVNATLSAGAIVPEVVATMTADAVDEKVAIVRAAAGARLADIEMNIRAFIVNVTDDRAGAVDSIANAMSLDRNVVETSPFVLIGPPSKLAEDLLERRERWGFSYIVVGGAEVDSFAPVVAQLALR